MPNWKKVIVSGSQAQVLSVTSSNGAQYSGSIYVAAGSNINVGQIAGSTEASLVLGAPPAGGSGEGGQLALQPASGFTSGSFIDQYQTGTVPYFRILRGSAASSDAILMQIQNHTKQLELPAYNSTTAFTGTVVGILGFDSAGRILTTTSSAGGSSTFPYTGNAQINGGLGVTGSISATGPIYSTANGQMYFRGGDDAEFWDINVANTVGIYGQQDATVASVKLGSGGGTISGKSGNIGIGTTTPTATLDVNGTTYITGSLRVSGGITGSLQGTATNATSASFAATASNIANAITNNTDNRVLTATGGSTINGEANLTFDGSILDVTGGTLTVGSEGTYAARFRNGVGNKPITIGSDSTNTYIQSWGSAPLFLNNQGNYIYLGGSVGANSGLTNASSRPAVGAGTLGTGEIRGYSNTSTGADDGFLRLSAGGGNAGNVKSYIDLSGYSTVSDMDRNIVLGTAGVERMRIDNSGNVGIGFTNPSEKLDVSGSGKFGAHARIGTNINAGYYQDSANGAYRAISSGGSDKGYYFQQYGGAGTTMYVGLDGTYVNRVGIGTTAPSYPLHLANASTETGINITYGANDVYLSHGGWGMSSGKFGIGPGANPTLILNALSNYVGVNTKSPSSSLHVYQSADITNITNDTQYAAFISQTNEAKRLALGYSNTYDAALIQGVHTGVDWKNLALNPAAGNVGIGTTGPGAKLTVVGSTHLSGSTTITGSLIVTGSAIIGLSSSAQNRSVAFGEFAVAAGTASFAQGYAVSASGNYSHAQGNSTIASGNYSHTEGFVTYANGDYSHAEGSVTYANGSTSHAEGGATYADGANSHTEGQYTATMELGAHAEGLFTVAGGIRLVNAQSSSGNCFTETEVYVQGNTLSQYPNSCVAGNYIHFIAPFASPSPAPTDTEYDVVNTTILSSSYDSVTNITRLLIPTMSNFASIDATSGAINYVFLQNFEESQTWNTWYGNAAHAEGYLTIATGRYSHAEGYNAAAIGEYSHAAGQGTHAYGTGSSAEGLISQTGRTDTYLIDSAQDSGVGYTTITINSKYGDISSNLTAGNLIQYFDTSDNVSIPARISSSIWSSPNTIISVYGAVFAGTGGSIVYTNSVMTGDEIAGGKYAHAEGYRARAIGEYSHAEGNQTWALAAHSHAEGADTIASGYSSHTEGSSTVAQGNYSHAEGYSTTAFGENSHAEGLGTYAGGWALQTGAITAGVFDLDQAGDVTSYFTNGIEIVLNDINSAIGSEPTAYIFTVNYSTWNGTVTTVHLTDTSLTVANKCIIGIYQQPSAFSFIDGTYGVASHAAGEGSQTIGNNSYAGGNATIALGWYQHVVGKLNQTSSKAGAFIIGNGSEGGGRNNLMLAYDNRVEVTGSVMATMGFTGSLLGTAATASFLLGSVASASFATTAATASFLLGSVESATSASVVQITNNTSTAATYYPTFVSSTSGHNALNVDSSALTWNPNTNTLTAANFAGNATSATSATTAGSATSAGTATNANNVYNTSSPAGGNNIILFATSNQDAYVQPASDTTFVYEPNSKTFFARNIRATTSLVVSGSTILSGSTTSIIGQAFVTGSTILSGSTRIIGPATITGSAIITGSLRGNVILPTLSSNTASLDFTQANFFTCSLANGVTTHISASNYLPGQTINVLINQGSAGTGRISFPAAFKSGSLYTGSAVANAVDIVTFITFDTTNIYLSAIRNLK